MIQKANEVSRIYIPDAVNTPLGIEVSLGPGLLLLWAGFAIMTVSIIPSMITYVFLTYSSLQRAAYTPLQMYDLPWLNVGYTTPRNFMTHGHAYLETEAL